MEKEKKIKVDKEKVLNYTLIATLTTIISFVIIYSLITVIKPVINGENAVSSTDNSKYLERIEEALVRIQNNYIDIDDVDMDELIDGAISGMADAAGDPYTHYVTEEEYNEMLTSGNEKYGGIGLHLTYDIDSDAILVVGVMPNTPAYNANIKAGDIISKVGDKVVTLDNYTECVDDMKGEAGESVHLTILRGDEVIEKEDDDFYHEIDSFNFIDVISADEFKDNGNLTYILGKDEENKTIYSNLKDSLNFVIFGNNKEDISAELNSVIISLMLKNSVDDINLIICDTDKSSKFRVYDGSNYMFFNRVANSNREIFDAFSEISIEINSRYDKFASMSVKNLDDYNLKVDANNKLPYLLVIYNNYSNNENAEFYDEINSSLFSMLKLGRLVGVYVILTSNSKIDNPSINYNFPTRLAFKQETEDESVSTLGVNNASKIKGESEFIWFSVLENKCLHLIAPSLSNDEIKNLIQTIENN